MKKRIVVTGMGTVSPLGQDLPTTWEAILAGQNGVGPITRFDTTDFRSTIAAEVKGFDPKITFRPKRRAVWMPLSSMPGGGA
jgi:3-oxoacyl-(acyl-carrier-protein) synthase